jgi:hypothetical protein
MDLCDIGSMDRGDNAMANRLKTIVVPRGSELDQLLDEATEATILLEKEGLRFRLDRVDAPARAGSSPRPGAPTQPHDDSLLGLIGILDEGDPTDVANCKDEYLAEAAARRGA